MKNSLFLCAVVMLLNACSSEKPALVENDPNALPPGIMQPVAGTGAVEGGSWMPEVKQETMPANMK